MTRADFFRYSIALATLTAWMTSNISEPFKKLLLSREDVRIYREDDVPNGRQLVAIHNLGEKPAGPIYVNVRLPAWAFSDFTCGPSSTDGEISFWSLVSHSDGVAKLGLPVGERGLSVLDVHYPAAGLESLRAVHQAAFRRKFIGKGYNSDEIDRLFNSEQTHPDALRLCQGLGSSSDSAASTPSLNCGLEFEYEAFERSQTLLLLGLLTRGTKRREFG